MQDVTRTMATRKGGKFSLYNSARSVHVPVFSDLEKCHPQQQPPPPNKERSLSPIKQKYREPILGPHEREISLPLDRISSLSNTSTNSAASSARDNLVMNLAQEQRTISVSSGENIYSGNRRDHGKRPPKRRHHSDITPGYIDETSFHAQYKRARINYLSQGAVARSLQFKQYEVPPPMFTLETLTSEIKQECTKSLQSTETLEKKLKLKSFLETLMSSFLPGCTLHLCGSSSSGFGNDSSDADFCLILSHLRQATNRREAMLVLRNICRVLHGDRYSFIDKLQVIPATVPILKFMDTISGCECDININNIVGVRNTHLLRGYCGVDHRVQPLVLLVKRWAKKQDINDACHGTLSSYALTLMVIHYLQAVCKPAVVPVLQLKYPAIFQFQEDVRNLLNEDPCSRMACNKSDNQQSLGELLLGFFKYYAEDFRWTEDYISIKMGSALPRNLKYNKRKHIIIEEPFDGNNVAKAVCSEGQFNRINLKFRLAWHTLRISPSLESIKVT